MDAPDFPYCSRLYQLSRTVYERRNRSLLYLRRQFHMVDVGAAWNTCWSLSMNCLPPMPQ